MPREINAKFDALFVEGPDDGAMINALAKKALGLELARKPWLVRTNDAGGGRAWALEEFDHHVKTGREGARIGVIVDRDTEADDVWPSVRDRLRRLGATLDDPPSSGAIVGGCYGIWMWPDNESFGGLETFVAGIMPPSGLLGYAAEACRIAKDEHDAEYKAAHAAKAALKVRSVWCDATAAGGYGHLVRNLPLVESAASTAFLAWFRQLFLT